MESSCERIKEIADQCHEYAGLHDDTIVFDKEKLTRLIIEEWHAASAKYIAECVEVASVPANALPANPNSVNQRYFIMKTKQTTPQNAWLKNAALYVSGGGLEWSGKGRKPEWLRSALQTGNTLVDYLNPQHKDFHQERAKLLTAKNAAPTNARE